MVSNSQSLGRINWVVEGEPGSINKKTAEPIQFKPFESIRTWLKPELQQQFLWLNNSPSDSHRYQKLWSDVKGPSIPPAEAKQPSSNAPEISNRWKLADEIQLVFLLTQPTKASTKERAWQQVANAMKPHRSVSACKLHFLRLKNSNRLQSIIEASKNTSSPITIVGNIEGFQAFRETFCLHENNHSNKKMKMTEETSPEAGMDL